MAKERQMVSVGWEGRACSCGAEVSGHHGTGPARAACGAEPGGEKQEGSHWVMRASAWPGGTYSAQAVELE